MVDFDNLKPTGLEEQPVKSFKDKFYMTSTTKVTLWGILAMLPTGLNAIAPIIPQPFSGLITAIAGIVAFYFAKGKND